MIVAAENGELALERSKEAPSANGPIGTGGLLLSSEALDLLNKSGEGSLGTHTLASSHPSASHITHPAPSAGTSLPLPSQPASEAPEPESHIHSTTTESTNLSEGLDGSSVDGPVLEDSSCVDGPNVVGASSVVAGGGEGGTGADAVHALNSAPSGRSVSHSPDEENGQNSPEQVDVNPSVSTEGEDAGSSSQPESDGSKNSGVENAGPAVVGQGVQGNESMEESVLVGMLTSSHDQDSSACKDGGQEESELAGESEPVVEREPCPGDEKPADSFPTATQSSLPGGGSDLPSVVVTECSHSQRVRCQDSEDDVDEFFDAVSTPLLSPLDTSTEFEMVGKSTGVGTAFGVSDATSLDAAGLNIGDAAFVVAGVTTGETCDVDLGTGKDDDSGEVDVRKAKEEGDGFFDAVAVESKGEEKTEADIGEGKKEGDTGFDAEGVETKDEEKTEKDMGEGKGEGDGAFDDEGPGLKGEEKTDIDMGGEKAVDDRGFDDEGPGLNVGEKFEVDMGEGKGEGDRGCDDEGPGLKGEEKTEVDVEEGKGEGDRGFDDEGPGLKVGEKTEADMEEGKGEGDRGFDDEGPGLKVGEKTEADMEEGKGEGDRGFDDEGPGLKVGEKTEADMEEGKGEGDRGFDDEGVETKEEEQTKGDNSVEPEENLTEGSTKVLGSEEKEGVADVESLTKEGTKNQSPSETADGGEGADGEDKDENVTKTDMGVTPVVEEGMGAEGLQAQSSQHITDTRLGDGSSVAANRDSVDFPSERTDEDSAGVNGAQRVGEVAVRVSMTEESNDVAGTDVCERKESMTVSSESGEHGSKEPVAGVDMEGQLQDVTDKKVVSQVVDETDDVAAALNEQTGSDDTQNLLAFSAEVDGASPVSAPKIGSDDEQSTSKSAAELDETPVTLVSATALDQQLVMSASKADSEAGHSGGEAMDVVEDDGEARESVSGESCQQAPEEKEAEAEPQDPASEVPNESDSRKCQEESDCSKQTQGAESFECQGKNDVGVSEESEEQPDTLSPLLDARKPLNRDISEGGTSEDSEALLDNEEYDFDDIDEVLAHGSPVACKGKGGEQDLDDVSTEAVAEDAVSLGSRDSGLQDSICNRENEASQGDAASFGSRDSGLQENAPSKESEASKEDSASMQSRDSESVVEDAPPFPGKDSTAGAEGGAEGGTPRVKGSMESLDLEAKLDKMVSDDSGTKKTPAKEKHKQKKSTKFKRLKNMFK